MIELSHVTKRYAERTVVDDVSVTVAEGETLALLGTSGCGKTTTLKMVNRLVEPSFGTVRAFGRNVLEQDVVKLRRSMGYVIQNVGLFPHYTVRQNAAVVPSLLGWDAARVGARVDELLDMVGLPPAEYGHKYPRQLSGGQRQRIGLARALAGDPPVVLLDEPFGALDPITRRQLQHEFLALKRRLGKTMLLVTHDVAEAILLGDRICLLDRGRVQHIGTPSELLFKPANAFVRAFLDPNRLHAEMLAVSLRDLLSAFGADSGVPLESCMDRVDASASLLDVIERNRTETDSYFAVLDGGSVRAITSLRTVLEAFFNYRARGSC